MLGTCKLLTRIDHPQLKVLLPRASEDIHCKLFPSSQVFKENCRKRSEKSKVSKPLQYRKHSKKEFT